MPRDVLLSGRDRDRDLARASKRVTGAEARSTVVSADGATIAYRESGEGPAVVLVHGAMQSARSFAELANALSTSFRVCVPDRRGRGRSAAHGPGYGLVTEAADLDALLRKTGARAVFGLSSGALIALHAAETVSRAAIDKLAVYEPPLSLDGAEPGAWVPRYEREIDRGALAAAMVTILQGTGDADLVSRIPRVVLTPLIRLALRLDAAKKEEIVLRDLIPTVRYDGRLQRESACIVAALSALRADVLLLGGDRSHRALQTALAGLARRLPTARHVMLRGIGHLAADDVGRPKDVARHLRAFFGKG